jgi:outer membrane protein assembly factor BamB
MDHVTHRMKCALILSALLLISGCSTTVSLWPGDDSAAEGKESVKSEAVKESDEGESVIDTVIVNPFRSGMSSIASLWSDDDSTAEEKESVKSETVKDSYESDTVKESDESESVIDTVIVNPVRSGFSSLAFLWSNDDSAVEETPIVNPIRSGISVVWQVDLDQRRPASPEGFSLPAVVHSDQGELIIAGAQDRRIRIYNAVGNELDRIALDAPGESGALQLANGLVVAGDIDGILYGIDLVERKVAWRYALPSVLLSSPIAIDDGFIIQTAANHVYRMTADGKKLWSYTGMLGGLGMHLSASPAIHDNNVYAVFSNGDIVALKAGNGSLLWKRQLLLNTEAAVLSELKVPVSAPAIIPASQSGRDEDVLAVAVYQGEMSFISLRDGTVLGQRDLSLKSSPLLVGKHLYVADANGSVSALSTANGETLWKQRVSEGELIGPVLWQGSLWVADSQGMVYRLNLDGNVLASIELDGRIDRTPVVAANGVLVRNHLGTVYMLR